MSLVGIDIGTTGVKAIVFDESGKLLATAYREYSLSFPFPGAVELDSRQVIDTALEVIAQVANKVKPDDPVRAIGIASHGESFTPVGRDGAFLGNAMPSLDSRAGSQVRQWVENFGEEELYNITGHTPYPMYSLFKLSWIKENRPDIWRKAWKFLFYPDLLAFVLTGEVGTEYTVAAQSMFFDVKAKDWSQRILCGLDLDVDRLAHVVPPGTALGAVRPDVAACLGLDRAVTVVLAGHDQPVGALGCGAATPGLASYAIGTVECICPSFERFVLSPELMNAKLATYPHVLPGLYTTVAFNMTGGSVLKWVRDNLCAEEASLARQSGEDPYRRIISQVTTEPSSLIMLPHFGPTGTPHFDPQGTGMLFGMSLSTNRAEMLRAFLEGITYEMKWNLSILAEAGFDVSGLRAIGGGAKSDIWMQIKADILGVPLTTMRVTEATCMGAAILAGNALGLLCPTESWATPIRTFEPAQNSVPLYEDRFAIYREIYTSLGRAREMLQTLKGNE